MDLMEWFLLKWVKGHCRHICFLCKYKKRCALDRHDIFNKNKPP